MTEMNSPRNPPRYEFVMAFPDFVRNNTSASVEWIRTVFRLIGVRFTLESCLLRLAVVRDDQFRTDRLRGPADRWSGLLPSTALLATVRGFFPVTSELLPYQCPTLHDRLHCLTACLVSAFPGIPQSSCFAANTFTYGYP